MANDDHVVKFEKTKILSSTLHWPTRLQRDAIEIYKHNNSFNRKEACFRLDKAWYPAHRGVASTDITFNSDVDTRELIK